jgi:phospholipid/cholesterol/gamma-HCH transport system substrate-binding protein
VSRSLSRWQAVLLGLVVLVGLGLGGVGLFLVGSHTWFAGDSFHVRAGFKGIQGVEEGTRVRVQGINAGQVVGIEQPATPGGNVVVRMRIDGKMRSLIRSDAVVQIVGDGLIGGKVIEIHPGTDKGGAVADNAMLGSRPTTEIAEVLGDLKETMSREVVPTLEQARTSMRQVGDAADSFGKTSDAVRKLPVIRDKDKDPRTLLVRPDSERVRLVFTESDLFEPGRSALTGSGKQRLDGITDKIKGSLKHEGADLVVVACADPKTNGDHALARALTESQSATVANYLKDHHSIQKAGWVTWRDVTALGLGTDPYPGEDRDAKLPPARVEVLVFVPQK